MFGGNSNWRGPIWFPINFLLMEAVSGATGHFYGESLKVEVPTGSGNWMNLHDASKELAKHLPAVPARRPGAGAVPRVLPRRHRPRLRGFTPDGLDLAHRPVPGAQG